jgi:hypothetical protein
MNDLEKRVAVIRDEMHISAESLLHRLALFDYNERDSVILHEISRWLAYDGQSAMTDIINGLSTEHGPALVMISGFNAARLSQILDRYLVELFSGCYDEAYALRRIEIGVAHQESGVTPERYTGVLFHLEQ